MSCYQINGRALQYGNVPFSQINSTVKDLVREAYTLQRNHFTERALIREFLPCYQINLLREEPW